ncbi:hypothetical protein KUTeg_015552 [Tegillarca granosa]|uniref:Potassium channel tetramerisation-type BTB domain-containing protein n=1 Tax=Tegillarca granosa TaxID=220873 RepID=A0ABQ9EVZ2_TEGGR|nr:hypothetical protein KUTeg_015552 [Tegillarca granosa]
MVLQSTLANFPNTKLSDLSQLSENYDPLEKEYFFDRDPEAFNVIINAISSGELHMPTHICSAIIRQEMEFWKIPLNIVSECCWKVFCQFEEENQIRKNLKQEVEIYESEHRHGMKNSNEMWKNLENPGHSNFSLVR